MSDSSSFTSLMDLVESHLSKTSLQASQSNDSRHLHFPSPNLNGVQKGLSDTLLAPPNKILNLPRLGNKTSSITEVLAQQFTNMLIAKENLRKEEEERQRVAEEMKKLKLEEKEDDCVIDLMAAIIPQDQQEMPPKPETRVLSNSSSFESLFTEWNKEIDKVEEEQKPEVEQLPITTDMSYILFKKIKKGKGSAFGKVLTSRLRPVAAPYLKTEIHNPAVVRFDFSTKSPCDIIKERRLKPVQSKYAHMNMVERFMAITNKDGQPLVE